MADLRKPLALALGAWLLALGVRALSEEPKAKSPEPNGKLQYNRDIRPILADNCFACHGPDSAARKKDLRLDRREVAVDVGAIVPGKPDESLLVERIFAEEQSQRMPPAKSLKKLTDAQKETLKRWIAEGAEYESHWSLILPKRPEPPVVKNEKWVRNPIDRFILAELEKRGLQPAPEADRRTLARRLSLDLIGLPPEPAWVEEFVNDPSADAYEKYVEKLLQSPHWGEHRGRYWLDAARYADTHGIHFDNYREMWAYRDWVINAINKNMPFDQFTIEQLAGDLLPNRTLDQLIATGFNRCNITTNEGGVIAEEYLVLYTRDRTETVSQVWLGMTAGCAVCHNHKFDPLSQKDFYSLAAFFNNSTQGAMDGNIKDTPPIITVPKAEDRPRWDALSKELGDLRKQIDERKQAARPDFDKWLAEMKPEQITAMIPNAGTYLHAPLSEGTGDNVNLTVAGSPRVLPLPKETQWDNGHVAAKAFRNRKDNGILAIPETGDFEKNQPFSYGAWIKLPNNEISGAVLARMDEANGFRGWDLWIENGRVGAHIINKWMEDALKVVSQAQLRPREWNHVFITYDGSAKAAGLHIYLNGVRQDARQIQADALKSSIRAQVPLKIAQRNNSSRLIELSIHDVRIYERALTPEEVENLARGTRTSYLASKKERKPEETNELFDWWLPGMDKTFQGLRSKVSELTREESAIKARGTVAHVSVEKQGEPTAHVLFRGEYDKRRDEVKAATPEVLPAMPGELPKNRLGFAQWLLRPEHPLTTRVTVNRFWSELFGTGLVRTAGDFGVTGELPSHPELLDWLAVEFREGGWDVKKFFKLIVTSATYRQSALVTPEKLERDRDNRLLSRGPRYRMDAEMIRDYGLAASGLLAPKLGGPSVRPYQPEGVWEAVAMIGSNTRDYKRDTGENLYRRSMYTFWKRAAPPASMEIMNAPNRETCTVRRERTNTPLQALLTLNDVQLVEAARHLAQRALKEGGDKPEAQIDFLARRLLARPFRPEELKVVQSNLEELLGYYKEHADDAKKLIAVGESKADPALDVSTLAAWTMLANQLMNLDEVLNK